MAEFQIAVKYQPPSLKNAFLLMCVMLPVWSIVLPLGFGIGMTWFFMNLSGAVAPVAFTFAMFCLALYLIGYTASAASEDKFIHVQKEGIAMPLFMLPMLAFRRMQPWQNLKAAHIVTSDNNKVLMLTFEGPKTVKLNVNHLDKEKLESFSAFA